MTLTLSFIWNFLPQLMAAISFTVFIANGNTFDLPQAIEILMLFQWIQGAMRHLMNMQEQIADLRLCIRRIQDYLLQDEVPLQAIVSKDDK